MCLMVVAAGIVPGYPLICFHNREEAYSRPTGACDVEHHSGDPSVICARDQRSHGTWMGFNVRTGAFAMLTNARHRLKRPGRARSRGELVDEFLSGRRVRRSDCSNDPVAYNMVCVKNVWASRPIDVCFRFSSPDGQACASTTTRLPTGRMFARSNEPGPPDTPPWPKTKRANHGVDAALRSLRGLSGRSGAMRIIGAVAQVMGKTDRNLKPSSRLLATTNLSHWQERACQEGPFVRAEARGWPGYGTRSQSAVIVSDSGDVYYAHRVTAGRARQDPRILKSLPWSVFHVSRRNRALVHRFHAVCRSSASSDVRILRSITGDRGMVASVVRVVACVSLFVVLIRWGRQYSQV